ncbi:MAG: capsular biosynthesis protein [Pseudomonadota bacterium]
MAAPGAPALRDAGGARVRTVLMLQGPASSLWREIGARFEARGHRVVRVNLSFGDWLFWRRPGAINYQGRLEDWEAWLEALLRREGVSDILYFADRLPYHRIAAELAARLGRRAWAVENGYLRPDWLTLEPFAMGRYSRFTRCPDTIRMLADEEPPVSCRAQYPVPFRVEAANEVMFNLAHVLGRLFFPRYQSDKVVAPVLEYLGWVPHLLLAGARRRAAEACVRRANAPDAPPQVMLALQMETDYQIRASSDFKSQAEMLEVVIASFARRADPRMRLIVKIHPFDNGLIAWGRLCKRLAARFGVVHRVEVIRGGRLDDLLSVAQGLVTINSTTGVHALRRGCPVIVLGDALFDVPGLTHQSGLDRFWSAPEAPDRSLVDAWSRALAAEIQVRGSQMNPEGRRVAAHAIVRRIEEAERYWRLYDQATVEAPEASIAEETPPPCRAATG